VNGQRELITELFNFFVAMTKESHLVHVIISSSDGYFVDTVYKDSRLKKTSSFFKVDYLSKEDVCEWLENLEKYSKITDYRLTRSDIEKIWDVVGGSMWEIQKILTDLFTTDLDSVLNEYKKFMRGIIDDYIGFSSEKETILRLFSEHAAWGRPDLRSKIGLASEEIEEVLHDLVFANIFYYDPTKEVFYSQGKSIEWGIKLYFREQRAWSREQGAKCIAYRTEGRWRKIGYGNV
jgi:AAA+ ATPase superfamily predicted ATPase